MPDYSSMVPKVGINPVRENSFLKSSPVLFFSLPSGFSYTTGGEAGILFISGVEKDVQKTEVIIAHPATNRKPLMKSFLFLILTSRLRIPYKKHFVNAM